MNPPGPVVHLCQREAWETALKQGAYRPASLQKEGFIHFSRPDQIYTVANQFYRGLTGMVLLWVDPQKLRSSLQWDPVEETVFPHLYGELNLDAVYEITEFPVGADGIFRSHAAEEGYGH
jgi:uncharacterized protein (DUF952 family)